MPNLIQIIHSPAFTLLDPAAAASAPRPVEYQDGWRCCQKCSGLFYGLRLQRDPNESACAAGDKHDSTSSKDYMVPFGDSNQVCRPPGGIVRNARGCSSQATRLKAPVRVAASTTTPT
jgi:hypothetical protein